MKFLFTFSFVLALTSSAFSLEADDVSSLYWRAGADKKTGLCPNGSYINPGANETCAKVQAPSPELIKAMKESVGSASCNINELIAVKQTIAHTLDQFYCSQDGIQAAVCTTGLSMPVYGGLRLVQAGGLVLNAKKLGADVLLKSMDIRMNRLVASRTAGAIKGGKAELALAKKVITLGAERIAMINQVRAIESEIAKKTVTKAVAGKVAKKLLMGASGVGTVLLVADVLMYAGDKVVEANKTVKPTDRFKGIKGFSDFALLSDKEQCEQLAIPDNEIRESYVSQSVAMQTVLSARMPEKTIVKCGPREGTTMALLKFRDGTYQMRGFTYDDEGQLKSASGYHLAVPMNPEAEINFTNAYKLDQDPEAAQKKEFQMTVDKEDFTFSSGAVQKSDPGLAARQEKKAFEESTRLSMVGPLVYETCKASDAASAAGSSGQGKPSDRVQDAK